MTLKLQWLSPLFAAALLFSSCTKDYTHPKENRIAEGLRNGEKWTAYCIIKASRDETKPGEIIIGRITQDGGWNEELFFHYVSMEWPENYLVYKLSDHAETLPVDDTLNVHYSMYSGIGECMLVNGFYDLDDSPGRDNKLVLELIDGRKVQGSFDACFYKPGSTDTIQFKDVRFSSVIDWK